MKSRVPAFFLVFKKGDVDLYQREGAVLRSRIIRVFSAWSQVVPDKIKSGKRLADVVYLPFPYVDWAQQEKL